MTEFHYVANVERLDGFHRFGWPGLPRRLYVFTCSCGHKTSGAPLNLAVAFSTFHIRLRNTAVGL